MKSVVTAVLDHLLTYLLTYCRGEIFRSLNYCSLAYLLLNTFTDLTLYSTPKVQMPLATLNMIINALDLGGVQRRMVLRWRWHHVQPLTLLNVTKISPSRIGSRTKGHTDKRPQTKGHRTKGHRTKGHTDKRPQLPIFASIALLINVI